MMLWMVEIVVVSAIASSLEEDPGELGRDNSRDRLASVFVVRWPELAVLRVVVFNPALMACCLYEVPLEHLRYGV